MAFHGLTFPNQNVSSLDDRGFYRSFRGDGIIQGCEMSFTNDSITIQAGWLIACGGLVQIDGATTINFDEIPTSGYGRVMLQIDTSQASTAEDFAQLSYLIDYSASIEGFTAPVQEDINLGTGTIYQIVMAIVQISGGNLTSIVTNSDLKLSPLLSRELNLFGYEGSFMPNVSMEVDGEIVARLQTVSNSKDLRISGINNGNVYAGFAVEPVYGALIFGDGVTHDVRIRPSGIFDSTHQTLFRPNDIIAGGQIYGGHPLSIAENSSSRTLSNAGSMTLGTLSKPADASYGMQFGAVTITPNASSWLQISVNGASQTLYVLNGVACNLSVVGINTGNAGFSIRALTTFGGTISYSKLTAVWF